MVEETEEPATTAVTAKKVPVEMPSKRGSRQGRPVMKKSDSVRLDFVEDGDEETTKKDKKKKDKKRESKKDSKKESKKDSKKESKKESKKDSKKESKKSSKKDSKKESKKSSKKEKSDETVPTEEPTPKTEQEPGVDPSPAVEAAAEKEDDTTEQEEDEEEMRAILANMDLSAYENDDDTSTSSDESSVLEKRDVELTNNFLDHIVLAAPDLEAAILEFEEKTGIAPQVTGGIKGLGIKTARVSFEGANFLEIIAPDPEKNGPIGELLKHPSMFASSFDGILQPFHWAIRTADADAMVSDMQRLGYKPDVIGMSGANQDGTPKRWEMLYLYGHELGGMCPFFINWDTSDHPCETMPIVGELLELSVQAPADDPIHKLIGHTKSQGFTLTEGEPNFFIKFSCPQDEDGVVFASEDMVGFKFPE